MNKLKYIVLFVVISSVATFFIIFYNNLNAFDRIGYEIKDHKKTLCSSCKNIITLKDKTYYSLSSNLQLLKNDGTIIKTFNDITPQKILFKTSDNDGVVIFYLDKQDNNYYVAKFNYLGEQSPKNGPYKSLISDTKSNKNSYYHMTAVSDLYHIIKFDDDGKEIFNVGPYSSVQIMKEDQNGVIIKPYDNITKKYQLINYQINGEIAWSVEASYFYNLATFDNEFLYYTLEDDGKYIYKLNFDGTKMTDGPYKRVSNNNKLYKTSDNHYFVANIFDNKNVITIYDENLNVLKHIEGYNYANITKSIDSDDFVFTDTKAGNTSLVKIDKEGKQIYAKVINSSFTIRLFTKNEVVYNVKVNNQELNVYLDKNGDKKWENNDAFYGGTLYKEHKSFHYLVRNTDSKYLLKRVDLKGEEKFTIGPASTINRIAYFDNGDLLYFYKNADNDQTKVIIIDKNGKTVYEGLHKATENLPDRMILYVGNDEIRINRKFMY